MTAYPKFRACAAHAAPVFLDTGATIDKAVSLVAEAARHGARLIAFPEAFVPAFPVWAALAPPIHNHDFFARLAKSAVRVPGPEIDVLAAAAREHAIFVSIGVTEGTAASVGCLWNTNVLIGDDGRILNKHRKLVPTFYEKLVWANGDGAGLRVADTALGRIGALICGENTNPLARYALMAQGEQVHISTYPPVWPTRPPGDHRAYDLASAIRIRAGAHSFEAKAFNIVAAAAVDASLRKAIAPLGTEAVRILEETPRGVSMIIAPTGDVMGDTLCEDEGLLYQDIDVSLCVEPKQFHDVVGYYNRFDVFALTVDDRPQPPVSFVSGRGADEPEAHGPPAEAPGVRAAAPVAAIAR